MASKQCSLFSCAIHLTYIQMKVYRGDRGYAVCVCPGRSNHVLFTCYVLRAWCAPIIPIYILLRSSVPFRCLPTCAVLTFSFRPLTHFPMQWRFNFLHGVGTRKWRDKEANWSLRISGETHYDKMSLKLLHIMRLKSNFTRIAALLLVFRGRRETLNVCCNYLHAFCLRCVVFSTCVAPNYTRKVFLLVSPTSTTDKLLTSARVHKMSIFRESERETVVLVILR